jgi:hypothetical protein
MRHFVSMLCVCVVPDTQALGQSGVKFEVFNIAWDDVLNARSGPSAKFPIIATFLLG